MSDISICDRDRDVPSGDIRVCDEAQQNPTDIRICDEDQCAKQWPSLSLSGTETPVNGSPYAAAGGLAPYTFSISQGTINGETGQITDLTGACGSGTVTVTDKCGKTASITVRFASGHWELASMVEYGLPVQRIAGSCDTACCWSLGCTPPFQTYSDEIVSGSSKVIYAYSCCTPQDGYDAGCPDGTSYGAGGTYCSSVSGGLYPNAFLRSREIYNWVC